MEDIVEEAGALWSWKRILSSYLPIALGWELGRCCDAVVSGTDTAGSGWDIWGAWLGTGGWFSWDGVIGGDLDSFGVRITLPVNTRFFCKILFLLKLIRYCDVKWNTSVKTTKLDIQGQTNVILKIQLVPIVFKIMLMLYKYLVPMYLLVMM